MIELTHKEIIEKIKKTETLTAIEIIRSHQDLNKCSIIINDQLFSIPYVTDYTYELVQDIKNTVTEDIIILKFFDIELPEAWKESYLEGGIPKENHDRRVVFHPYDDMNEMFCIDQTLLWDITDEFKGTDHELTEDKCKWRFTMIKWYKNHLI